jgi:TolB-like protein/DNA-binding winged helix-turn-helix (wHTH) protein
VHTVQTYRFGEFELDMDAQQLRLRGAPVRLERRPFDLLALLVSRHGHMVPRDDIIAALWPANVIIDFDSGLNTLVRKVRGALEDPSEHPSYIETVPGRGYRFIAPIEPATTAAVVIAQAVAKPASRSRSILALALLLLAVGGAIIAWQTSFKSPGKARIAVLPFENLTGNDQLGFMAAGIAEDTSTSLAQIDLPNLSVIGGVSARAFENSAMSLPQIGRELGADFVVTSSLRLDKSRIRVSSRLIRVADNEQVWSASFDRELTNVLGLQRELSIAIAEQIRQRLSPEVAAAIDRRQTQNPEAYELYLKGRYEWTRFQPDSIARALNTDRLSPRTAATRWHGPASRTP